ncbi:MAG: anthranilate synthase component I family protein [Acidobacteriota bacterium]
MTPHGTLPMPRPPFACYVDAESGGRGWGFDALWHEAAAEIRGDGRGLVLKAAARRRFPGNPLDHLEEALREGERALGGGTGLWAVLLGYDLRRAVERFSAPAQDDLGLPWLHAFLFRRCGPVDVGRAAGRPPRRLEKPRSWRSSLGSGRFQAAVRTVLKAEFAGDVYQVNLTRRLSRPCRGGTLRLWGDLVECARPAFGAYLHAGSYRVLCLSPERFLKREGDSIVTEPIKGTILRGREPAEDQKRAASLLTGEKEAAELAMIVDVSRNDLGRVALPGSVWADPRKALLTLPYVHHLYGRVGARLRPEVTLTDLIRAAYPGASVTGAPKIRAMEVADSLEGVTRGPYCGALGWMEPGGDRMDLCLTIRTAWAAEGMLRAGVGGGIVVDSDPRGEWRETVHKARFLVDGLPPAGG